MFQTTNTIVTLCWYTCGKITDLALNDADLTIQSFTDTNQVVYTTPLFTQGSTTQLAVVSVPPKIITIDSTSKTYRTNQTISFTITFNDPVT